MAKGQQQGGALTVWMIIFVALWLTSTVFLVILYTGQAELKVEANRLAVANETLITSSERSSIPLLQQARRGGPTVVGLIEDARARTAMLATGHEADDPAAIMTKHNELFRSIRSDGILPDAKRLADDVSYHDALGLLYEAFAVEFGRRRDGEARLAQLEAEVNTLAQANEQQKADLDARVGELVALNDKAEAERAEYRDVREDQIAKLQADADARYAQNTEDLTKERQRSTQLEEQVGELEARLTVFREKCGDLLIGPKELSTARQADGQIVTYIPGDDVAYINLGRRDKLVLGLRFAVYPKATGIPVDGSAKAQIEVVSIDRSSAECSIVAVAPGQVIMQGDLIANPIYDSKRSVTFLVLGSFDLDHDGEADATGGAQIEAMIDEWGGSVASKLDAVTDFVVLGRAPERPIEPRDRTPEAVARFNAKQQAYDAYTRVVNEAKALSVPVLRQEVFLNFLGFGSRRASR